jgi:hypothetical protein
VAAEAPRRSGRARIEAALSDAALKILSDGVPGRNAVAKPDAEDARGEGEEATPAGRPTIAPHPRGS